MAVSPKLYVNKPKKAQLKQIQQQQASSPTPTPTPTASSSMASSSMARGAAPPPQPPKESFIRRYKYLWPMLLVVNFSIGDLTYHKVKVQNFHLEVSAINAMLNLKKNYLLPVFTILFSEFRKLAFTFVVLPSVFVICVAYLFMRTKKKDVGTEEAEILDVPGASISTVAASTVSEKEKEVTATPTLQPVIVREPIPENQQRELFKWMLEEKRRVKPKDQEEKKRIDEEKAILKHFIRAKSIPVL